MLFLDWTVGRFEIGLDFPFSFHVGSWTFDTSFRLVSFPPGLVPSPFPAPDFPLSPALMML